METTFIEDFIKLDGKTYNSGILNEKAQKILQKLPKNQNSDALEIEKKLKKVVDIIKNEKPETIHLKIDSKFRKKCFSIKNKKNLHNNSEHKIEIPLKVEKKKRVEYAGSATELLEQKFEKITLKGDLKKSLGRLYNDTKVLIWGSPGHGKTVKLLKWAKEFAEMGKKVVYVCNEEHGRSTFQEKLIDFKIGHPNLKFVKNIRDVEKFGWKTSEVNQWFFDSVNTMGMNLKDAREFIDMYPLSNIFFIVQSTKEGGFRGGKDWEHEVDIAGQVINRELRIVKNRLDNSFLEKLKEAETEDVFEKALLKENIKIKVSESLNKQQKRKSKKK